MSSNIKPRKEQDIPDSALSIVEMLEGKILEFNKDFAQQGKTETTNFDGLFKSIEHKGDLAKQIVILKSYEDMIINMPVSDESESSFIIDSLLEKCGQGFKSGNNHKDNKHDRLDGFDKAMDNNLIDTTKTNLPPMSEREDNVYELDPEETINPKNLSKDDAKKDKHLDTGSDDGGD